MERQTMPVWDKKEMWWWMWPKQCMSPVIKKLIMIRVMCCFIDIWTIQRNWFPSVYILQALTRPADNTQPLDDNFEVYFVNISPVYFLQFTSESWPCVNGWSWLFWRIQADKWCELCFHKNIQKSIRQAVTFHF